MRAYPLVPRQLRQECPFGSQYWTCAKPLFAGCCTIDPCKALMCPDSKSEQKPITISPSSSSHEASTVTVTASGHTMTSTMDTTPTNTEPATTRNPTEWWAKPSETASTTPGPTPTPTGAIIGGALGGVAALAILAGLFFLWRARRPARPPPPSSVAAASAGPDTPGSQSEHWPYPSPHPHSPGKMGSRGPSVDLHAHPAYVELATNEHTGPVELPTATSPVELRGGSPLAHEVQYGDEFGSMRGRDMEMQMQPHSPLLERRPA
ncbi:hypothetical protein EDC01DRAFT_641794 [Geopyxis carbonaria]|nr:hypothetical protein EDC01DRAFT_641794 [Geopyxis carbonaria]